ncbi:MAG: alpha-hydroxy acid oxidase [Cyanobacteria bacterium P01_C01_bin.147]
MPTQRRPSLAMPTTMTPIANPQRLHRFPMIEDVRRRAIARLPEAICGFLESGSGYETCLTRNRAAFDAMTFTPHYLSASPHPSLITRLFGYDYSVPFGIAPLGMADIVWPGTQAILHETAARRRLPFVVGMLNALAIEAAAGQIEGPRWLQLYPLRERDIWDDLINRADQAQYDVLVITIDCPTLGRRESMRRAGFQLPLPQFRHPRFLASCLAHPRWLWRTSQHGMRFCPLFEPYVQSPTQASIGAFLRRQMPVPMNWEALSHLRDRWPRHLVIKGVVNGEEAQKLAALGVDALWVSNHGGRQLDAIPASLDALRRVRSAVGPDLPILMDSGVRCGLDIARALASGADFVFLGRPFVYGTTAFDDVGGDVIVDILTDELLNALQLLGIEQATALASDQAVGFQYGSDR